MKQIIFYTTDWNYELVGETLRGVLTYLEDHPDVCVRVVDCFSINEADLDNPKEYEIYSLMDLNQYDGAVVQTNQIVWKKAAQLLQRQLEEKGIPAVTIGVPLGGFPQVGTDDYHGFYELTEHLITHHGARRLWFQKGLEKFDEGEQGEARLRRRGFEDACQRHGIDPERIRILDGNWSTFAGEEAGREILAAKERPDALVCANDDMALGTIGFLRDHGIRVPEDLMVTGFDGIFSAALCSPRLATLDRNFRDVGYKAVDLAIRRAKGEEIPPMTYNQMVPVLVGSCGCRGDAEAEILRIKDRFYRQTQFLRYFYLTQDRLSGAFFSADTLEEVMGAIEEHAGIFGGGDLRIYLDERYYRSILGAATEAEEEQIQEGHYSGTFVLVADSRNRVAGRGEYQKVSRGATQERMQGDLPARERLVQYYALRYGEIAVGVVMLSGLCMAADLNLHESIINEMVLSMETIRQRQHLNRLNQRLNELYVTDQLTGLNNRFGIARAGEPLFRKLIKAGQDVQFLFLDIDEMKKINDQYGHDAGDEAIRATAEVVRRVCRGEDYAMRYGGDEMIAFGPVWPEDPVRAAERELRRIREEWHLEFPLELSVGQYICAAGSGETLDACLQAADLKMYEMKKHRKSQRAED